MYIYAVTKVTRSRRSGDLYQPLSDRALSFSFYLVIQGGFWLSQFLYIFVFIIFCVQNDENPSEKRPRNVKHVSPFFFSHSVIHKRKHFSLFSRSHTSISQTHAENHPNNVNLFVDTEIPETTTVGARPSRLALAPERIPLSWLTRELENEKERERKTSFFLVM